MEHTSKGVNAGGQATSSVAVYEKQQDAAIDEGWGSSRVPARPSAPATHD
jgi:hypothetical protein